MRGGRREIARCLRRGLGGVRGGGVPTPDRKQPAGLRPLVLANISRRRGMLYGRDR